MSGWGGGIGNALGKVMTIGQVPTDGKTIQSPGGVTPWMDWMRSHIGEPEVTGSKATPFDVMVFSHTSDDEVKNSGVMASGCAATACAALELTGYKSPHSAAAISFAKYGTPCELKVGCIVVFQWLSGSDRGGHHVTFCERLNGNGTVDCLGGNQSHKLQISTFGIDSVLATRWPVA